MSDRPPGLFRTLSHMLAAVFNSRAAFHSEWLRNQSLEPDDPNEGRWIGEWVSLRSGHRGALRCVLTAIPGPAYRAHFYANYSRLFSVGYVTELKAGPIPGGVRLQAEENLGALAGGIYRCEGEIRGPHFECRYSCKYDEGVFRLGRTERAEVSRETK